jgi:hypothetical protein
MVLDLTLITSCLRELYGEGGVNGASGEELEGGTKVQI